MIYWIDVFICYFLHKVPNYFWIGTEFIFEVNILQEDLLASLIVCQVFALCVLDFLIRGLFRISGGLLDILISFHSYEPCFGDIVVLGKFW